MTTSTLARSVALFVVAGLMEIGGGYLVWLWLREHRGLLLGALGGLLTFSRTLWYPPYGSAAAAWGLSELFRRLTRAAGVSEREAL